MKNELIPLISGVLMPGLPALAQDSKAIFLPAPLSSDRTLAQ